MKPLSLRSRLILGAVGLLAVALLIADIAGMMLFRSFLIQRVDDQLRTPFESSPPAQLQTWLTRFCDSAQSTDSTQLPTSITILVTDAAGRVTCQLPQSAGLDPIQAGLTAQALADAAENGTILTADPPKPGDATSRLRVLPVDSGYAVLSISLNDVEASVKRLGLISLTVGVTILAGFTLAGIAMVRIGLRPLTRIERTAQQIAAGDLTQRIEMNAPNTEVGTLATALNTMLAQIETAFAERDKTEDRLRRFVADASHELRTPLTTIRGHAELVGKGIATSPADISRVVGRIEAESIRMSRLVEDLLLLARLDSTRGLEQRPIDLLSLAVDAVADSHVRAPDRLIAIRNPTSTPWRDTAPVVLGDDARLRQVLTNLLSNAAEHTPPGTPIEVEVGVMGDQVRLAVIDHGQGLRIGNEDRVFERFFREDAGRGRSGGTGLGLSICWTLIDKHGGDMHYKPTAGGGSTFEVNLPLSSAD